METTAYIGEILGGGFRAEGNHNGNENENC